MSEPATSPRAHLPYVVDALREATIWADECGDIGYGRKHCDEYIAVIKAFIDDIESGRVMLA